MTPPSDSDMRDLEQELQDRIRKSEANGNRGFLHLRREMSDLEEQKDVDIAIFDFITFKALEAIFEWRARPNYHESDLPDVLVEMTNDWLTFMQNKHGQHGEDHLNSQTRFRARLLQFSLIFTHRLNATNTWTTEQSLADIRAEHRARGSYWETSFEPPAASPSSFDADLDFPLDDQQILQNRDIMASSLGVPETKRDCVTNIMGTPSLHDLIPLFMQLTATRVRLGDWEPDAEWYELVCQWMVQAVIEAYLCCGASGESAFNTIFAFGCPGIQDSQDPQEPSWTKVLRILFCKGRSHPHEDFNGWTAVKRDYIDELLPHPDLEMSFQSALHTARDRYPIASFDAAVVRFLKRMHNSIDKPDLVQVEQREITIHGERLSEEETREVLARIGVERE